jgi:putative ABC transport system permease protein
VIRLLAMLVRLAPRPFRERHEAAIVAFLHDERRAPHHQSTLGAVRFAAAMAADLASTSLRLRRRQLQSLAARTTARRDVPALPQSPERTEMDTVVQDLRYALRQFVRRPGFTAIAVLSLALAIGGNSLIYGMLDGFVFHPFRYPEPDRLVAVGVTFPKISADTTYVETLSPAEYLDIRTNRTFAHAGSFDLGNRNISGGDVPERVFTALVLDDLFPVVGMAPALGRGFTREELGPNGPPAAIISHRLWHSRFGGDPAILTRAIRISGRATSVVGVMPPGLVLIGTDLWIPWGGDPLTVPRNVRQFNVLARLAPGATLAQANAELDTIARRVELSERAKYAEYENWRLTATPWAAALMQDVRPAAFVLLAAVGLVLLIACANLTNLFLARASSRQRELAVRLALGAARWRLTRLLLTESLLLAVAGAALGLVVVWFGLRGASSLIPAQFQMLGLEAALSVRVLAWSAGLAVVCGVLVGVLPALQAMRTDPHDSLKADPRTGGSRRGQFVRHTLVVAELALSVMLLLGAGLLMRSFLNIQRVDRGFDSANVLTMRLTLPRERYPGEAANAFFEQLSDRLAALPGVRSVSASSQFPPLATFGTQFKLERGGDGGQTLPTALITTATPSYFATLNVPLRAGRLLGATDRLDTPPVAMINQAFASRYLAGVDPVGQRLAIGSPDRQRPWATIVGVVADYRNNGLTQPVRPEIFTPVRQQTAWNQLFMLIRTESSPGGLLPAARRAVTALDPEQPVYMIQTLDEALATASFQQRISALLLGIFAAVALVLAAIGIYGVMSYAVTSRTQEMGVRLAIGAQRRDVIWLVMRQVVKLSAIGLTIGVVALFFVSNALESLLVGVRATDPVTLAAAVVVLGGVALAAAWVPASRASQVDPIEALRYE